METEKMIRELKRVEEIHKHDKVFTGGLNIAEMARDVRERLEELKPYEDTGLTPEQIIELKERDTAKAIVHNRTRDINGIIVFNSKLCPNCGRSCSDDYDDYNFCPDCGQRLKWEK